ncbi:hypothetical protein BS47DRAFT_783519 [Hydnum rufescens UP504]|uniref:Uncharacterized protein n=1 Tax=Hydnum rufescens UP504 TaxID=1448309 RepID=A0A9P6DY33_9AGAM|nr:hypothetical protein BS47DRAFT_783519 [Hydnum rufescens UP504]
MSSALRITKTPSRLLRFCSINLCRRTRKRKRRFDNAINHTCPWELRMMPRNSRPNTDSWLALGTHFLDWTFVAWGRTWALAPATWIFRSAQNHCSKVLRLCVVPGQYVLSI